MKISNGGTDGGILVTHGQFDWNLDALPKFGMNALARNHKGRAFRHPDLVVGFSGLFWPEWQDAAVHDEKADRPGRIQDTSIHEELPKVFAYISDGRRI